jgi:hypothetical protein
MAHAGCLEGSRVAACWWILLLPGATVLRPQTHIALVLDITSEQAEVHLYMSQCNSHPRTCHCASLSPHPCVVDHSIKVLDVAQAVTAQTKAVGYKPHACTSAHQHSNKHVSTDRTGAS